MEAYGAERGRFPAFEAFQPMMMELGNPRQSPDIPGVGRDGFPDHFHLRAVPLESLVMVLLPRGHLMLASSKAGP